MGIAHSGPFRRVRLGTPVGGVYDVGFAGGGETLPQRPGTAPADADGLAEEPRRERNRTRRSSGLVAAQMGTDDPVALLRVKPVHRSVDRGYVEDPASATAPAGERRLPRRGGPALDGGSGGSGGGGGGGDGYLLVDVSGDGWISADDSVERGVVVGRQRWQFRLRMRLDEVRRSADRSSDAAFLGLGRSFVSVFVFPVCLRCLRLAATIVVLSRQKTFLFHLKKETTNLRHPSKENDRRVLMADS